MNHKHLLGVIIIVTMLLAMIPLMRLQVTTNAMTKIDSNLVQQMEAGSLNGTTMYKAIIEVAWNLNLNPIKFHHDAVVSELKAEAASTQQPVLEYLKHTKAQVLNTFWIDNLILIKADEATIRNIATLSTVEKVLMDFRVTVPQDESVQQVTVTSPDPATWNIQKVGAPQVWANLGIHGEGVKFCTEDTGIDLTHPDLAGTLFTANPNDPTYPGGWSEFDADGNWVSGSVPHDTYGHGTATYGLIVGDNKSGSLGYTIGAVGMAPKAIGMHTLCLPYGGGAWPEVIAGLQWILDPVDAYGNHYSMPAVSSHSWGDTAGGYQQQLVEPIENLYMAGQTVVCAIGNEGEGTHRTPGDIPEIIGCGMTDINDNVDPGSSGTTIYKSGWSSPLPNWPDQWIKPDVSAPGSNVIVPYPGNQYVYWGGTSFATPTVAGAVVLMLSADPSLNSDQIKSTLESTAVWYNTYYPSKPDDRYGWGRIDAFAAVSEVAIKSGVLGTVTDSNTGLPLSKVQVSAGGRTASTDDSGNYKLRLYPGAYDVTFTRWGYYDKTVTGVVVNANQFTTLNTALTSVPPGYVEGTVYFQNTMEGIPGASVIALGTPIPVQTQTDVNGYYKIAIPPGTYDFEASAYMFKSQTATGITVVSGSTTQVDFALVQPSGVAVIGDYNGRLAALLTEQGKMVDSYPDLTSIMPNISLYTAIIVNFPSPSPSYDDMNNFISATTANGIGVLWLDTWMSGSGGYWLWYYSYYDGLPIGFSFYRYTTYYTGYYPDVYNYMRTTETDNDILNSWPVGTVIPHDIGGYWHDSAFYYMYDPETPTRHYLASFGIYEYGYYDEYQSYTTIVKIDRGTNRWMMLSLHANDVYTDASGWSPDSITVFMNSLNWAAKPSAPHPKFVVWNLTVTPQVGLWSQPRTVSVGVKDLWLPGTTTIKMYVDSTLEGSTDVTLNQGESTYLTWTVSRFNVGAYTVTVRNLATTFTVRAPIKTIQAYQYNSNNPLAGADVYGYYRTYNGPGWQTQWSYTYGGYGHSQFAQPVGDLDGDGKNEVVVGGYETSITPGYAHILKYNTATGSYDTLYTWNSGGSSPSGAAIADFNHDGKNELVMSWGYGSSPGVYAYTWDGTTLKQLDYYAASFDFDVYACDLNKDGTTDIIVSNAPWGGTPYHVFVLDLDKTTNTFVFKGGWACPLDPYFNDECSMSWSGDIYGDGNTELVSVISEGPYATAGVWALTWDGTTFSGTQIYASPLNLGTPYGISIGYVKGDNIPEIGIGNNYAGYVGAEACLLKYNTATHVFDEVWDGQWSNEYSVIEGVAIGDAYNNGKNVFLAAGGNTHIIGWTGTGYEEIATITQTQGMIAGCNIGDMDNDGKNEVKCCDIIGYGPGNEWIFKYSSMPMPGTSWAFQKMGTTDTNGKLVFNSPASVVDMYLFIYKDPSAGTLCQPKKPGYDYLLTKYDYIDSDMTNTYSPKPTTEAQVIARPNALGLETIPHQGIVWVQKQASFGPLKGQWLPILWPFTCNKTSPADIVITPETYTFRHMLNEVDQFGSWWYYFMAADQTATLSKGQTYSYKFAGTIQGSVKHTQTDTSVTVTWTATDGYSHQITGISLSEVGWLSALTYVPVPLVPSTLNQVMTLVGQTSNYYPLISLYGARSKFITSGYITWDQKPAMATVPSGVTVSYAELDFVSGPYGNPWAKMYVTTIVEYHR